MYGTVRRYEGVTNPSEVGCQVRETFLPLISEIPGFVAYYLVDAGGGVLISTGVFQDKAASEESNRRAAEWIRESRGSLLPNPPQVTAGEVVARKSTYEGDGSQEVPKRLTNRCLSTRADSRR